MATTITRAEAVARIHGSEGRVIGLTFRKRTTGEIRSGSFRLGVIRVKGDLGSGPAYRPEDHGLIRVWDMAKGYRSVPVEGLLRVVDQGEEFEVADSPDNPA